MSQRERRRGSTGTRVPIALACDECGARNYKTTKRQDQVVELRKFCSACGRHTVHRESK